MPSDDVDQNPAADATGPVDMEDQNPAEDATDPVDDMEEIRQRVSKVKEEIVQSLQARLSKDQMFRRFRQSRLNPVIYYAVYKELRSQNEDFFELYMLKVSLKRQTERLNHQLAMYRELRRRANASAGGHRCGNPSCSGGHRAVAVPVPHAEATPRAMSSTPLAVPLPATAMAMAQHAHRNLPRMMMPPPQQPNCGGRPGSSRGGGVRLFAAGRTLEMPWQPHAAPNGWPAGHGHGHPASGTLAAGMACSSPPVARASHRLAHQTRQHGGGNVGERQPAFCRATPSHVQGVLPAGEQQQRQQGKQREQRWHAPQVGAQHQNLQQFPLQQGGGNVGERQGQGQFSPPTPSHVQEQRPPPPVVVVARRAAGNSSSGSKANRRSNKPTTAAAAARRTDAATVASRHEPMTSEHGLLEEVCLPYWRGMSDQARFLCSSCLGE